MAFLAGAYLSYYWRKVHCFVVGHITPEAIDGGLIGLLKDGDKNTIDADLSEAEIENRRKNWEKPHEPIKSAMLRKYVKLVANASEGCVTD